MFQPVIRTYGNDMPDLIEWAKTKNIVGQDIRDEDIVQYKLDGQAGELQCIRCRAVQDQNPLMHVRCAAKPKASSSMLPSI